MNVLFTVAAGTLMSDAKTGGSAYRTIALMYISGWSDLQCFDSVFAHRHQLSLADASQRGCDEPHLKLVGVIYTDDTMAPPRRGVLYDGIAYGAVASPPDFLSPEARGRTDVFTGKLLGGGRVGEKVMIQKPFHITSIHGLLLISVITLIPDAFLDFHWWLPDNQTKRRPLLEHDRKREALALPAAHSDLPDTAKTRGI